MIRLKIPERIFTDRLVIQRLRYEDAEEIFYTYASKPEATRYVSWKTHRSINDTIQYLNWCAASWNQSRDYSFSVRLKSSNRLIGSIGVINDNGRVQFGYVFSPTQWNKGYATEVCKAVLSHLKQQTGISRIHTFVDVDNVASQKVLLKSGLLEEARIPGGFSFPNQNGKTKDCIVFYFPLNHRET